MCPSTRPSSRSSRYGTFMNGGPSPSRPPLPTPRLVHPGLERKSRAFLGRLVKEGGQEVAYRRASESREGRGGRETRSEWAATAVTARPPARVRHYCPTTYHFHGTGSQVVGPQTENMETSISRICAVQIPGTCSTTMLGCDKAVGDLPPSLLSSTPLPSHPHQLAVTQTLRLRRQGV